MNSKRGSQATDGIGILPKFKGRAMHDGWPTYFTYACEHALGNAHHLRELTFVDEQLKQPWAGEMIKLMVEIKQQVRQAAANGAEYLPANQPTEFEQACDRLIAAGVRLSETNRLRQSANVAGGNKASRRICSTGY